MDLSLAGVGATVLAEGVKFFYTQAGELLKLWRERKSGNRGAKLQSPPPPPGITVGRADPIAAALDEAMVTSLTTLQEMLATIRAGDLNQQEAREVIANVRDLLEVALKTRITFAGEAPRPQLNVNDVRVTAQRVIGNVSGLRANLQKLTGKVGVGNVIVQTGDVEEGGDVVGLDLT
jgi:hypothetical protein